MDTPDEASFRALYASWPTERLARASTMEKGEYRAEAVVLMLEELKKRGLAGQNISALANVTPPPAIGTAPGRDTRLLPARLSRRKYAIRTSVFIATTFVASLLLEFAPAIQPAGFIILLLGSMIYGALGLLLPRSKDAGLPSWIAIILGLFPATAFFTFLILFFVPSKKYDWRKPA